MLKLCQDHNAKDESTKFIFDFLQIPEATALRIGRPRIPLDKIIIVL
jgi:hypothetical protein